MPKNALSILKADHAKVRKLLKQLVNAESGAERTSVLEQVSAEVNLHAAVEEEIFYPAFHEAKRKEKDGEMYYEAVAEHGCVHLVLPDLESTPADSDAFAGKAKVLKELIEHHAEEEEDEMFPRAKTLLGEDALVELGARIEARKAEGPPPAKSSKGRPVAARRGR